jgi:Protein of unknown function (DUF2874).
MKNLAVIFSLISLIIGGVSCSSDDSDYIQPGGSGIANVEQSEIKVKIANYYSAPSSSSQPVANIQPVFNERFPNATDIEWKVSNNVYEIDFEINNVDHEAWYDSEANLLMYKYDIANSKLPLSVLSAIANDYPGYVLDEAERVYKGSIIGYYVDLKKNKTEVHAFYDDKGFFISKNLWEDDSLKPANDANSANHEISGNVSDDEVDALIAAYYSGNDIDVPPSSVPAVISGNFGTIFPNARDIEWETSANVYKVDFEINNVDYDAWYKQDGTLLAYKFDITRASVPENIKTAISTQFNGYTIDDAEKVVKVNSIGYFVELKNRNIEEDAFFGEDGTYISNSYYKRNTDLGGNVGESVTPEIPVDGSYTDSEIDALLLMYNKGKDMDIKASNVPTLIASAFNMQFALARDIEWDYVNSVYKVEFEIGNMDYEAWYVEDGTLLMYTQEVRYNAVAKAVQDAVLLQYPEYTIDGCDYFQKGKIKGYIIELENKRTDAELIVMYQENGTFIHQQRD